MALYGNLSSNKDNLFHFRWITFFFKNITDYFHDLRNQVEKVEKLVILEKDFPQQKQPKLFFVARDHILSYLSVSLMLYRKIDNLLNLLLLVNIFFTLSSVKCRRRMSLISFLCTDFIHLWFVTWTIPGGYLWFPFSNYLSTGFSVLESNYW